MRKFPNLFIVSVTGTIAAGKTTLINALKEDKPLSILQTQTQQKVVFIPETHTIQGTRSYELAPAYFASNTLTDAVEREKINLDFQLSVLADLHDLLSAENEKAQDAPTLVILERSWMDVLVFAPIALPNPRDLQTLKDQIDVLFCEYSDYTLYLDINPSKALQRAVKRAQKENGDKETVSKFGNINVFEDLDLRYKIMVSQIPKKNLLIIRSDKQNNSDFDWYASSHQNRLFVANMGSFYLADIIAYQIVVNQQLLIT